MQARFGIIEVPRSIASTIEHALMAEAAGFNWFGVADSQSLFRELFVTLGVVGQATKNVMIGPTVTNPLTRHPAVMASAIASVQEITNGRVMLGLGTGDSALYNLNERPKGLEGLREYITTVQSLLQGDHINYGGREIHTKWIGEHGIKSVPIYIAAEGPKTLELAGEICDGVICGMGFSPEVAELTLEHLTIGAQRAGRSLKDVDIWAMTRVNIGTDRGTLIDEIRMELASTAHHAFRFTQKGKLIPEKYAEAIRQIQAGYSPANHEDLGESPNASLMANTELLEYMAERFAIVGTADQCVERIQAIRSNGIHQFIFTGFVDERAALIKALGETVFPRCRN